MEYLKINGGFGESGGQIVRSAIAISCITKQPIILENIRKNRKVSGLKPQHLTAIKILQKISNAKVEGAELGSTYLKFYPDEVKSLELTEDIKTAGSISLIFQVLIPVVAICQKRLNLKIKGGTDVLWSPSMEYTKQILKEAYKKMGIEFSLEVIKRGYFPKGGGEVNLQIFPSKLKSITFTKNKIKSVKLFCSYSKIKNNIIKKQIQNIEKLLTEKKILVQTQIKEEIAIDSGSSILISSINDESIVGVDCLFDKKMMKFNFQLEEFSKNSPSIDYHLADMLVLPASLAQGMTVFQVSKISKHLETNLFVISKITGCKYGIGKLQDGFEIRIQGISNTSIK